MWYYFSTFCWDKVILVPMVCPQPRSLLVDMFDMIWHNSIIIFVVFLEFAKMMTSWPWRKQQNKKELMVTNHSRSNERQTMSSIFARDAQIKTILFLSPTLMHCQKDHLYLCYFCSHKKTFYWTLSLQPDVIYYLPLSVFILKNADRHWYSWEFIYFVRIRESVLWSWHDT